VLNVLKNMLRRELGKKQYSEYATYIKENIRETRRDSSEIFNDLCVRLREKELVELACLKETLEEALLASFQISKNYVGIVVVYAGAFILLAEYAVQMAAIPAMILLSLIFLFKTYEFLVNKFCYIDARMVLILRAALERVLQDRKQKI